MRKLAAYFLLAVLGAASLQAQTGKPVAVEDVVEFDKTVHDFGAFLLSDGPQSCSFTVKNISQRPIAILHVVSSCGCTDVSWTKAPVKVGESGLISATYSNDQGAYPFEKTLTVYISSLSNPVILRLRGNVTEKKKPLEELYPIHLGRLGIKETEFKVGNVNQGGQRSDFTLIANLGKTPLKLDFTGVSAGLSVYTEPESIEPGSAGKLIFTVTSDTEHWGKNWYYATPVVDGKEMKKLSFWAFTKEDFSSWTKEQKENGAQPIAKASTYSFGIVKAGKTVDAVFDITNQGKSTLKVYKADSDSPSATPQAFSDLAAGASVKFHVKLDTTGLPQGEFLAIITLTTNAPLRPIVNLFVSGAIE